MNADTRYSIGDLARPTGLTVKTIRFYSDQGIVPPTDRSAVGYRRYDVGAVARLDLVRTLRDLGLNLATIRKVVDLGLSLAEVATAHAEALTAQIRTLHLRRAVLTAVARNGSTPEEMRLMHRLAKLSEDERRRLVADFLVGEHVGPAVAAGIDPSSPQADPVIGSLTAQYAQSLGCPDDVDLRRRLRERLETVNDPRREQYLRLLALINGWPSPEPLAPALAWSVQALRVGYRGLLARSESSTCEA